MSSSIHPFGQHLSLFKIFPFCQVVPKASPPKVPGVKLTKNFASPDCTAKVSWMSASVRVADPLPGSHLVFEKFKKKNILLKI